MNKYMWQRLKIGEKVLKTNELSTVGSKTASVGEPDTILCKGAHKLNVSQIKNLKKKSNIIPKCQDIINLKVARSVSYFYSIPSLTVKVILQIKYLKALYSHIFTYSSQYSFLT